MSEYQRGARLERQVKAFLEEEGWFVIRAAGSKGPADLVALKSGYRPMLVACTLSRVKKPVVERLVKIAREVGANAFLATRHRDVGMYIECVFSHE